MTQGNFNDNKSCYARVRTRAKTQGVFLTPVTAVNMRRNHGSKQVLELGDNTQDNTPAKHRHAGTTPGGPEDRESSSTERTVKSTKNRDLKHQKTETTASGVRPGHDLSTAAILNSNVAELSAGSDQVRKSCGDMAVEEYAQQTAQQTALLSDRNICDNGVGKYSQQTVQQTALLSDRNICDNGVGKYSQQTVQQTALLSDRNQKESQNFTRNVTSAEEVTRGFTTHGVLEAEQESQSELNNDGTVHPALGEREGGPSPLDNTETMAVQEKGEHPQAPGLCLRLSEDSQTDGSSPQIAGNGREEDSESNRAGDVGTATAEIPPAHVELADRASDAKVLRRRVSVVSKNVSQVVTRTNEAPHDRSLCRDEDQDVNVPKFPSTPLSDVNIADSVTTGDTWPTPLTAPDPRPAHCGRPASDHSSSTQGTRHATSPQSNDTPTSAPPPSPPPCSNCCWWRIKISADTDPEGEVDFHWYDVVLGLAGLVLVYVDLVTDLLLTVRYLAEGQWVYGAVTAAVVVPSYLFSYLYFAVSLLKDRDSQRIFGAAGVVCLAVTGFLLFPAFP